MYIQEKDHQQGLWLYQVATGSNVRIVAPVTTGQIPPTFSNDGNYVYYVDHEKNYPAGVLCKVASLGGEPRKLFENLSSAVTFSPDGNHLAFLRRSEEESQLTIANEDGSAAKPIYIVRAPAQLFNNPAWSPDGTTIVVPRQTPSPQERRLVAVSVAGGEAKPTRPPRLVEDFSIGMASREHRPNCGGTGRGFAGPGQIYAISYPVGEVRRITFDLYDYNGLGLTADGKSLVTVKNEIHSSVWVGWMDKGQAIKESVQPEVDGADGLDWTPDGRIVYTALRAAEENLAIMDADGSRRRFLTTLEVPGEFIAGPSVCGDGRHVIAVSTHGGTSGLIRIDADGTNMVRLMSGTSPSCSPDGKWVIFESNRTGKPTVWKVPIEGGEQTQLTSEECRSPTVSPDGGRIACLYTAESNNQAEELAIFPAAGGDRAKTFGLKGETSQLAWAPDGQSVTYAVGDVVADNLWNQAMRGGPPRRITKFDTGGILSFAWSRNGKRLAVARGSRSQDVVLINNLRGRD